ncbi:MAG: hypothetical protein KAY09_05695, partial [Nitrospira sp.]|nr:hypothetical protein [Nitrospira sp.]
RDPFEKTGCQDVRRGVIYPGKLVCLVFRSNPSLFCGCYPIIGQCREAQAYEGSSTTTDDQATRDSAGRSNPVA